MIRQCLIRKCLASFLFLALAALPPAGASEFVSGHPAVADAVTLLDLWIGEQMEYQHLPGLAIGVVYDQELIWARGYGFADFEKKTPMTPETVFRMGSITKLFTSVAVLQLRDRGKLRLDDPVGKYLPWFEVQSSFDDEPQITVRHLLTHTAGLPREAAFPYWTDHDFPTRDQIREALPSQSAVFAPATRYKYSNLGMALLGALVEEVSGEPIATYVEKNVLAPLGMTSSSLAPTEELLRKMTKAFLRRTEDGHRRPADYYETRGLAPAANLVSSVVDMSRFAALQLRGDPRILKDSTIREMHRPHWVYPSWKGGRGLGFAVSRRDDKTIVFHGGWVAGYRSVLLLVPDEKLAVVAMTNADDASPSAFAYQALDLLSGPIAKAVAPAPQEKRADPAWQRFLGEYVDPWGWEYKVMILGEELVMYDQSYPPEDDPRDGLTKLEPVSENSFRMGDGELVVFETDDDGHVVRIQRRYDYIYPKKR